MTEKWRPYIVGSDGQISRRYWELCLLSALRDALRAGNVCVAGRRRYANPETYYGVPLRLVTIAAPSNELQVRLLVLKPDQTIERIIDLHQR